MSDMNNIELIIRVLLKMGKIWGTCILFSLPFLYIFYKFIMNKMIGVD